MWFGEELVFVGSSFLFCKSQVWLFQAPCLLLSSNAIPIPPSVHTMALPWVKVSGHQRWNRRNQFQLWKLVGKKDNENQCQSCVQILIFNCWAQHASNFHLKIRQSLRWLQIQKKKHRSLRPKPFSFSKKKTQALTTAELEPKGADQTAGDHRSTNQSSGGRAKWGPRHQKNGHILSH